MARPNALVAGVSDLPRVVKGREGTRARGSSQLMTVKFDGGRTGLLDMTLPRGSVWADVLGSLHESQQPAYVEIDPTSHVIVELLCPSAMKVEAITPLSSKDGVQVDLTISHARHYLHRTSPDYDVLLKALQTAHKQKTTVLVTETLDAHEIIHVAPLAVSKTPRRK